MDKDFQDEVKFTYSGVFPKNGKKIVHIYFERVAGNTNDYAEGSIPDCLITRHEGFSEEEITKLETYLRDNMDSILTKASEINLIKNWMNS